MATDRQTSFGALLRHYRTAAGLTQEELAARAGVSTRAISDLERGARTKPWRDTVVMLANALELATEDRHALERAIARTRRPAPISPAIPLPQPLPVDGSPLIGREREEAAIVHLLQRDEVRLLTLTGPGGVGKTRLALRVATTEGVEYADGVYFVSLAPLPNSEHVISAIAGAIALSEIPGQTLQQTVGAFVRQRRILLFLDNFEHVLDAAPLLGELLTTCGRLTVLVTSRESLHLRGEQEFQVSPLALPPTREPMDSAEQLARYPATSLFLARVRSVVPNIRLGPSQVADIAEICRQLDGLPLAIELAAAQLKYESPSQLLARLQRRFDVLIGGPRDLPSRQQSLRDCLAWSYNLLSAEEQLILGRFAVFAGGIGADVIEEALDCDGGVSGAVRSTVRSLVDKSLLSAVRPEDGEIRITMLATVREYALERLREAGASDAAYRCCAGYYLSLANQAENAMWGPDEATCYQRLMRERDNLRVVLAWALDHDVELGLSIAGALRRFWTMDGNYTEWHGWLEKLLAAGGAVSPAVYAKAMLATGWVAMHQGDIVAAVERFQAGLNIARDLNDPALIWVGVTGLGFARLGQGDVEPGIALFQEGFVMCREVNAPHLAGPLTYGLGLASQLQGNYQRAREHLERAVAILQSHDERYTIGTAVRTLGGVGLIQGEYRQAQIWFQQGLHIALVTKHREGIAGALAGISAALAALGQVERAARLWGAAEAIFEELFGPSSPPEAVPYARLTLFSPHLTAITAHFSEPRWKIAQHEGYVTPLDMIVDDAFQDTEID